MKGFTMIIMYGNARSWENCNCQSTRR